MKSVLGIAAKRVILAQDLNTVSVVDVLDDLSLGSRSELPPSDGSVAIHIDCQFLGVFELTDPKEQAESPLSGTFWIDTPTGRRMETEVVIDFSNATRYRAIVKVFEMIYDGPGTYTFNIKCRGELVSWRTTVSEARAED